ncbi:hypothetical protein ACS0TY_005224 [Phlomoides rotata]
MSEYVPVSDVTVGNELEVSGGGAAVLPTLSEERRKKKKSGAFGIFKAALYILRKKPDEKEAAKKIAESDGNWKKIVGSMRPLHVQEMPQSPSYQISPSPAMEYFPMPSSPAPSTSGTMSQYASAQNLRDLDNCDDEDEDPDEVFDAITGDELIDAKAEEFIAQFYKQIQMQNTSRFHHEDRGF